MCGCGRGGERLVRGGWVNQSVFLATVKQLLLVIELMPRTDMCVAFMRDLSQGDVTEGATAMCVGGGGGGGGGVWEGRGEGSASGSLEREIYSHLPQDPSGGRGCPVYVCKLGTDSPEDLGLTRLTSCCTSIE